MREEERPAVGRRPGPVYDDAMKVLADDDLPALLSVVDVDGSGAERLNAGLAASTMAADLVARTGSGLVHVEFVKDPAPDLDLRMVDYRLRLRRAHRTVPIAQFVLALRDLPLPQRYLDPDPGRLVCSWTVVRISERDPAELLRHPTTAAVAALGRGTAQERAAVLTAAADLIAAHTDPDRRDLLLAAAATLASIVLPRRRISAALKEARMPVYVRDTPLGRELYEEGREEGREQGGREAAVRFAALMLRQRFGDDPRVDRAAAALADLPDEERLVRLTTAAGLDDLTPEP